MKITPNNFLFLRIASQFIKTSLNPSDELFQPDLNEITNCSCSVPQRQKGFFGSHFTPSIKSISTLDVVSTDARDPLNWHSWINIGVVSTHVVSSAFVLLQIAVIGALIVGLSRRFRSTIYQSTVAQTQTVRIFNFPSRFFWCRSPHDFAEFVQRDDCQVWTCGRGCQLVDNIRSSSTPNVCGLAPCDLLNHH